jgi:hypothetical protein
MEAVGDSGNECARAPPRFTSRYKPQPSASLYGFSRGFALRITVSESILGVSDLLITPIPPEIPPRLIGCHRMLVNVSGHAIP